MITNANINNKKKVLLITNHKSGDILLNLLQNCPFIFEVRIGSPNILKEMTESFLILFDCVIYDLCDGGFGVNHENKKEIIEEYIKNDGGSFLVTHDQWDYTGSGPLNLIGLERLNNFEFIRTNKARVYREHELFNSYNNLTNWGKIDIATTHQTFHKIIEGHETAKTIIELQLDKTTSIRHNYLVVNEVGLGRIAYWAAGDSNTISENEKKLFINIVAWLTKYKN